jgi:H/ACA ribonucleoprotein complex subunit 4
MKLPSEKIIREIIIKKISLDLSKEKQENIEELINSGIININKPQGPTSHQVADYVKKILNIKKVGHSGTLDPNVTGCLVIALGDSTRIVHHLLKAGKEYVALMYLHKKVDEKKIREIIKKFIGEINQKPPVKSAVKRVMRQRKIYYLNILEIDNQNVLFEVGCEAGTYIRKLIHDIGKKLDTNAHMVQLIRTKVGPFSDNTWHSLYELKDAYEFYKNGNDQELKKIINPINQAIKHLAKIWIDENTIKTISHGADLAIPGVIKFNSDIKEKDTVAILTLQNELVCTGIAKMSSKDIKKAKKGIVVKTKKVFMKSKSF